MQNGPGFVAALLDIPFVLALPNATCLCYDPKKGVAAVQTLLKEGSRAFFRNMPIQGPTTFEQLKQAAKEYERPRVDYSYLAVANLHDGQKRAALNIHCGTDGGFAEVKYYSEVHVTFLEDDLGHIGTGNLVMERVAAILNPFLDKYRLLMQDFRVGRVASDRNFYVTVCHTSPLTPDEVSLSAEELFARMDRPRTFRTQLGLGAMNVLRINHLEHLLPRAQMTEPMLSLFGQFAQEEYELPLSYDLILEALRSMQSARDFKLAIVHAATAVEVQVLNLLHKVLILNGNTPADAWTLLETDPNYQGVKNRLKRLEEHTRDYCAANAMTFAPFLGGSLHAKWDAQVATKRNRAVHAGVASFTFSEASAAIGIAKETINFLDNRISAIADRFQIDPSMAAYRESGSGILF
jgi:hypothetical protein